MKLPTCPEHGDLVLDLARGRLNDAEAMEAESVRETCRICSKWWNTTFADRDTAGVDDAVAQAFADFSPVAGRRRGWLAVAAAAVLAVGVGTTTMLWRNGETTSVVAERSPAAESVLATWDFEGGTLTRVEASAVSDSGDLVETGEAVFVNDLESGDLGSWSFHS